MFESIGMYAWGVSPGSLGMAPNTSQRTTRLPAIMLAVALVTSPIAAFGSRVSSPNPWPVTGMLEALVPPGLGHQPVPTRRAQVCHIYQSTLATYHLLFRNIPPFLAIEGGI